MIVFNGFQLIWLVGVVVLFALCGISIAADRIDTAIKQQMVELAVTILLITISLSICAITVVFIIDMLSL